MGGFTSTVINTAVNVLLGNGPFRPPQWSQPALTSLSVVVPGQATTTQVNSTVLDPTTGQPLQSFQGGAQTQSQSGSSTTYFFDGVIRLDHNEEVVITDHPVQNGASISDHAYALPARVVLEIWFSDAMDSYKPGQYSGGKSKSVTAYKTFKSIKDQRLPCTLATRLNQYTNMIIEDISVPDTNDTVRGLKMIMRLRQIIIGTVSQNTVSTGNAGNAVSTRPNQTSTNQEGTLAPSPPSSTTTQTLQAPSGGWNSNATGVDFSDLQTAAPQGS